MVREVKIAILTEEDYGYSGIEKVEKNLVKSLEEEDFEIEKLSYHWTQKNFPLSRTFNSFIAPKKVEERIENLENVDKIFVPSQARMLFNPENVDAEVIVYVHDIFPVTHFFKYENERSWLYRNILSLVGHWVKDQWMRNLIKADKILTPTEYVKEDLETHTPYDCGIEVIGQGVDDLPQGKDAEDSERDIDLLYVGGLHGRKNPNFLKKCLKKAEENGYTVKTVTSNDDLPGENFESITDDKLISLYSSSRFYMHPSYVEGFGRPPVEAQRYGGIPLALDTKVNREVLGEKDKSWIEVENKEDVIDKLDQGVSLEKRAEAQENSNKNKWCEVKKNFLTVIEK